MVALTKTMISRRARLATAVAGFALCALPVVWLAVFSHQYAAGRVVARHAAPAGRTILSIESPFQLATRHLLCEKSEVPEPSPGQWVVVRGSERRVGSSWVLLETSVVRVMPAALSGPLAFAGAQDPRAVAEYLARNRALAAVMAVVAILTGYFLIRILGALLLGTLASTSAWHILVLSGAAGVIDAPDTVATPIVVAAFVAGAFVALRESVLGMLARRAALVLVAFSLTAPLVVVLGWPSTILVVVAVVGTLASPALGLALISTCFLSLALRANVVAANLMLAGVLVVIHILTDGAWLPEGPKLKSLFARRAAHGQMPLVQLLGRPKGVSL